MESKMTMDLVLAMKKEERNVAETHNNLKLNYDHSFVRKPNVSSNLINGSIKKENPFSGCSRGPIASSQKIRFNTLVLLSLVVAVLLSLAGDTYASPYIMSNCLLNSELAIAPQDRNNCEYGFEEDACGTYFCSKGPKSYCGGKFERYGVCGEGLMCNKCNRCTGCSTKTFECWYDDNCIWSSD